VGCFGVGAGGIAPSPPARRFTVSQPFICTTVRFGAALIANRAGSLPELGRCGQLNNACGANRKITNVRVFQFETLGCAYKVKGVNSSLGG